MLGKISPEELLLFFCCSKLKHLMGLGLLGPYK